MKSSMRVYGINSEYEEDDCNLHPEIQPHGQQLLEMYA